MTTMTTTQLIRQLRKLKNAVLEDGKIDWDETEQIREAIRPLSVRREYVFEDYEQLLKKCREDGKITPDESRKLAIQLDLLCSLYAYRRLAFWLTVIIVALVIAGSAVLVHGLVSSADADILGEPPPTAQNPCPDRQD